MPFHQQAQDIIDSFNEMPPAAKLDLLLEYADGLPDLPTRYQDHPELMERVEECQSPVFLFIELDSEFVFVYLTAPREAPTTRGFAAILQSALTGQKPQTVLDFDDQFVNALGLTELVSPLRIRGMHGMLQRIKRQVREKLDASY